MILILIVLFSIGTIQASDVNGTDVATLESSDEVPIQFENSTQLDNINTDLPLEESAKNQTQLTSPKTSVYYNGYYSVTLMDLNANTTLANKKINFVINDVLYSNVTDGNGVASIKLDLSPGKYTANAYFEGDDTHDAAGDLTSQIEVLPTIKANNITKYYKGSKQYYATFYDSYGNALKNTYVTITVNGKSYTKKTDNKGSVSFALDFKPGNYKVIAKDPKTGYTLTTTLKISPTICSSDFKKVKGDSRVFTVKFLKSSGNPLANQYVKIKINGKTTKYKTNSKGQVRLPLNNLKKGSYNAVCYNKDGLSKTYKIQIYDIASTKLTVNTPNVYTLLPDDSRDVVIKLSTSVGGDTKVGKTIKININGQSYYRKTDSNGAVNFKIPVTDGIFTIEYSYAGDKFFKPSKVTKLATIFKTNDTTLTVKSTKSFGYGAGTLFKVAFSAGKVPLAKRTVTFNIDGKTYNSQTDENGIAAVAITQNIGNYTINYKAPSDYVVKGTSGSCAINVFERSPSKVIWKCGTKYKDSSQSFKVLVLNSKGEPISGGNVELTIDGETYVAKTNSNGYATIKTSVALGKYKVSVKFLGNNYYLPNSTSHSINVELSKFGRGLNVKDNGYYSSAYLKSTKNCQVNNAKIKSLVKSLTSGLTNKIDKAKAIFNYVRDNIEYDYYYDSRHGAVGTLNAESGNCADQAHLLVAMYRAAGFKARYVHGTCSFSDGWYGHVWTQVLVDGTWIVGDPINHNNALGKISNWNTNTYKLKTRYLSLPF